MHGYSQLKSSFIRKWLIFTKNYSSIYIRPCTDFDTTQLIAAVSDQAKSCIINGYLKCNYFYNDVFNEYGSELLFGGKFNIPVWNSLEYLKVLSSPNGLLAHEEGRIPKNNTLRWELENLSLFFLPICKKAIELGLLTEVQVCNTHYSTLTPILTENGLTIATGKNPIRPSALIDHIDCSNLEKALSDYGLLAINLQLITLDDLYFLTKHRISAGNLFSEPGLIALSQGFIDFTKKKSAFFQIKFFLGSTVPITINGEHVEYDRQKRNPQPKNGVVLQFTHTSYSFTYEEKRLDAELVTKILKFSYKLDDLQLIDFLNSFHQRHFPDAPKRKASQLLGRKMLVLSHILISDTFKPIAFESSLLPPQSQGIQSEKPTSKIKKLFDACKKKYVELLKDYLKIPNLDQEEFTFIHTLTKNIRRELKLQPLIGLMEGLFSTKSGDYYIEAMELLRSYQNKGDLQSLVPMTGLAYTTNTQ